jgi:RNA polymerase sigma-70 factor (ECF subfamily)
VREADLEDLSHDVFLVFHRKRDAYDPSRPIKPWLFAIAARVASDYRSLARTRNEKLDDPPDPHDPRADVEAEVERRRAQRLVQSALARLAPERSAVFILHELDGFAMPEVADALGIPLNTGYSRLRLARVDFEAAVLAIEKGGQG